MKKPILLWGLLFLALALSCVTVDEKGRPVYIDEPEVKEEKKPPGPRDPSQFPVRASWTRDEQEIPLLLAGLPDSAPDRFTLPYLPPVGNQGRLPNGTAWAAGYTALSVLLKRQGHENYICSPSFPYNMLHKNKKGVPLLDVLLFIRDKGCPSLDVLPYSDSDLTSGMSRSVRENAARHKPAGFSRVDFTDLDQVRSHLLQGSVVIITMRVTENFLTLKEPLWKIPSGYFTGKHGLAVVGFDHKKRHFILQNSAGRSWGEGGYARIPYSWFLRLCERAYILW